MKKILTLQQRLRLLIILLVSIVLIIGGAIIYPTIRDILALQTEIDTTEAFLESQYQKTKRTKQSPLTIASLSSSTVKYTMLTVDRGTELNLIETFETIADKYTIQQNLTVEFIEKKDAKNSILPYYEFTFLHNGLFENQLLFLDELLSLPYIVSIEKIDIQQKDSTVKTTEKNMVSFRFSAKIYVK